MKPRSMDPTQAIQAARQALRRGDAPQARHWAEMAAKFAPQREEPWLILAAVAEPNESVGFARKALQINPDSGRGLKAMAWALRRLSDSPMPAAQIEGAQTGLSAGAASSQRSGDARPELHADPAASARQPQAAGAQAVTGAPKVRPAAARKPGRRPVRRNTSRNVMLALTLMVMGCMAVALAAWTAVNSPVMASILSLSSVAMPAPTQAPSFGEAEIAKPTYTPTPALLTDGALPEAATEGIGPSAEGPGGEAVATETSQSQLDAAPVASSTPVNDPPTATAEATSTPGPTETPVATETPGTMFAEIVPDTPTPEYVPPTAGPAPSVPRSAGGTGGAHWIDVDLSQQRVYAYEGEAVVNSFVVSTGTWQTPTVTGKYKVWIKLRSTSMTGPGYYLPDVPYVMYFYKGYGFHGTYWHNNFGTPMSHGCVNLTIPDAEWLYDFAAVGTVVNVHY
jgi:lipoprotein-anchoring transpeptidase ErfK/SrfK